jgi:hypothetical protein
MQGLRAPSRRLHRAGAVAQLAAGLFAYRCDCGRELPLSQEGGVPCPCGRTYRLGLKYWVEEERAGMLKRRINDALRGCR